MTGPRVTLTTERLTLRPLTEADVPALVVALDDYNVSGWLTVVPFPYTEDDARGYIAGLDGATPFDGYGIFDRTGLVGGIGINPTLGYWMAWDAWGRGYATEAAEALVGHYFASTDATSVEAGHFEGNTPSAHVLAKLGFVYTGVISRVRSRAQGIEINLENMILSRDVWEARHG